MSEGLRLLSAIECGQAGGTIGLFNLCSLMAESSLAWSVIHLTSMSRKLFQKLKDVTLIAPNKSKLMSDK
jgi:hypothetical protein